MWTDVAGTVLGHIKMAEIKSCIFVETFASQKIVHKFHQEYLDIVRLLGLIHTRHFHTQYYDKKIKDIEIKRHFSTNIFSPCELKIVFFLFI